MKDLALSLDLVRYKKYIFNVLAILLGVCVTYFGIDLLLTYFIDKQVGDTETLLLVRAMVVFLFLIIGVAVAVYIFLLVPPMYRLITFKGTYHLKTYKEGLILLTPLDIKEKKVPYERIIDLNLDLKETEATLRLEVKQSTSIKNFFFGTDHYKVYLELPEYQKLKEYLQYYREDVKKPLLENGKPI